MAADSAPLPVGIDPLIAEAKQRARRRRVFVLALVVAVAGGALSMFYGLRGTGGAAPAGKTSSGFAGTPFRGGGGSFTSVSGFMGDRDGATSGTTLGCIEGRHYEDGFGLWNRSHRPVTVLSAYGLSPAPGVEWIAAQVRVSPYRRGVDEVISRNWSSRPTGPVTIPPGREATVESNFTFRRCGQLAGGRTVRVPGSLTIRYRTKGVVRRSVISVPGNAFVLAAGPMRRMCAKGLVSTNISCAAAQEAALACHRAAVTFAYCKAAGTSWLCDRVVFRRGHPYVMTCDEDIKVRDHGAETRPRGFKVRWSAFTRRT